MNGFTQIDFDLKQDCYQTPYEFVYLPAKSLDKMADYYERMADLCRNRSSKIREFESIQKRANERFEDLRRIPFLVLRELSKGIHENAESAIKSVSKREGLSLICVKTWYKKEKLARKAAFIKHRDSTIVQMVGLGIPYQTIASTIDVHPNTITRAIKRELGVVLSAQDKRKIRSNSCQALKPPTIQK